MELFFTPSTGLLSQTASAIVPPDRIPAKAGTLFHLDVYSMESFSESATGILSAKQKGSYTGNLAAQEVGWTALSNPTRYHFDLDLNTTEIMAMFSNETPMVILMLEISWTDGTEQGKSQTFEMALSRQVYRGDEQIPTPATVQYPVIIYVETCPVNQTDFFMFDNGVAPAGGLYQATDSRFIYTYKGGDAAWTRTPKASW
jgi:hypothetical protein